MLVEKAEAEEQASYHLLLPALMMSFPAFEAFGEWRSGHNHVVQAVQIVQRRSRFSGRFELLERLERFERLLVVFF
jgi:hypothetical protein